MERVEHRVNRLKGSMDPPLFDVFEAFSETPVDRGSLGWSEDLISVNEFLGCDDHLTLGAGDFDKIALFKPKFLTDLFRG